MDGADSHAPLLTIKDVLEWVKERDALKSEQERLAEQVASVEARLRFAAMLMSSEQAARIIGQLPEAAAPSSSTPGKAKPKTISDGIFEVLASEDVGRPPHWLRKRLAADPELSEKVNAHSVSNTLSRLRDRDLLVRVDGLYFLPSKWEEVGNGLPPEEHVRNIAPTFTSRMRDVACSLGKAFDVGELRQAALATPDLAEKVSEKPNSVNSWVARQVERKELLREGRIYRFPSNETEAPNGNAMSASATGGVAAPSEDSRGGFSDLLG